jgi:hypothetical protein
MDGMAGGMVVCGFMLNLGGVLDMTLGTVLTHDEIPLLWLP